MTESRMSFTTMTRGQKACVPVLVLWPVAVYYFPSAITDVLTLFVYIVVGIITRCLPLCMCTLFGALCGLSLDAALNGGTHESRMWETLSYYATGAGIGMLVGFAYQTSDRVRPHKSNESS